VSALAVTIGDALRKMGSRSWLEASNAGRRFPRMQIRVVADSANGQVGRRRADYVFRFGQTSMPRHLPKIQRRCWRFIRRGRRYEGRTQLLRESAILPRCACAQAHSLQRRARDVRAVLYFISQHGGIVCREA
jgi:hypothetical protein